MNYLFYLSIQRIPLGIAVALEFTGPLAVALFGSRRPLDFVWVVLAVLGLWYLLPLGQDVAQVDLTGALLALGAGACWAVYILTGQRAGEEHGPATVAMGSLIAAVIFVPLGMLQATDTLFQWSLLPLGLAIAVLSTALPYSLEMIALTRMPTKTFGTLMSMEPALAALSGMVFLGETLTFTQTLALGAIILASMGSTLTMRRETKLKKSISAKLSDGSVRPPRRTALTHKSAQPIELNTFSNYQQACAIKPIETTDTAFCVSVAILVPMSYRGQALHIIRFEV